MSPSWLERVTITLSPHQVTMVRYARGLRRVLKDSKVLPCPACVEGENWQPALDTLRDALVHPNTEAGDAIVVLSNHFVRYLLLPWNPDLVTVQEELAFVRARFVRAFGKAANGWVVKFSPGRPGAAGVACAIESPLLDAVTALMAGSPLRLRSIQPSFMAVCNARRRAPRGNAWVAMAEPGRLLLGSLHEGQWLSLRSRPMNGHASSLRDIIKQESMLLGVESNGGQIYLHRTSDAVINLDGVDVELWLPEAKVRAGERAN